MRCVGVILKFCRLFIATADSISLENSTNAIPCLPVTRFTFLKPGYLDIHWDKGVRWAIRWIKSITKFVN